MKGASQVSYAIVSEYIYLFIYKKVKLLYEKLRSTQHSWKITIKKIIYWFLDNREQNKNQETFNSEARPKGGNTRYNFFCADNAICTNSRIVSHAHH